jgi:hypothetical protein
MSIQMSGLFQQVDQTSAETLQRSADWSSELASAREIVGERVVAGLLGEGRLGRLCGTNADLSDLEIVLHRKLFKTYEVNSPPVSTLLSPGAICRLVQWGFCLARCCLLKGN